MKHETLTRVQAETLQLLFKGLPVPQIAALRHRSPKTVQHTIEALKLATDTHTDRELIYEALVRRWLTPPQRHVE